MKRFILLFAFILSATFLFSQKFDFSIPDIEKETTQPTFYDLTVGSNAGLLHETYKFRADIRSKLKRRVIVYVHDTAGQFNNQYLKAAQRNDLGKVYTGEPPYDGNSHGTHVAGIVGAYSPNFPLGTAEVMAEFGFLWIIPRKVLTNGGDGNYNWVNSSLLSAIAEGSKYQALGNFIIHNISLGGTQPSDKLQTTITAAREAGQMVIIAAGNTGATPLLFPGRAKDANAIAAVDSKGERAYFSSYGEEVYLSGFGVQVLSTIPGGGLANKSGTSMATPAVVGFAAVIASTNPKATANQIERFLATNATFEGESETDKGALKWNKFIGYGIPQYSSYKDKQATDHPDTPLVRNGQDEPDDPENFPERESRLLTFLLPTYSTIWKTASGGEFYTLNLDFKVSIVTQQYDERAYDLVKKEFDWFFHNRGFVLLDHHGFKDAIYYSGFFAEMILNRRESKLGIKVQLINGSDDKGRSAEHKRRSGEKLSTKLQMLRAFQPYSFSLN